MPKGIYDRTRSKPRPPQTSETKRKISISNTGKKRTEEHRQNIKNGLPPNRKLSKEHKEKLANAMRGKQSRAWNGGRHIKGGYVQVWTPTHPCSQGGYVPEHRLVVEQHIGRLLTPSEVVHHEGDKTDNRIHLLILFGNCGYHGSYHRFGYENGIIFDGRLLAPSS